MHDTCCLGGQLRQHKLASRNDYQHVDAVDAPYGRRVCSRLYSPVRRVAERNDQHRRHGVRHGGVRQRDAGPDGHNYRRGPRPEHAEPPPAAMGRVLRTHRVRKTPSDAHRVSTLEHCRRTYILKLHLLSIYIIYKVY